MEEEEFQVLLKFVALKHSQKASALERR